MCERERDKTEMLNYVNIVERSKDSEAKDFMKICSIIQGQIIIYQRHHVKLDDG